MISDYEIGYALSSDFASSGPGPDVLAFSADDPFVPNDPMDWFFGIGAVVIPYIGIFIYSGPAGVARYSAAAPDMFMFAGGVALSNTLQAVATHRGGRYSTTSSTVTSGFMMV